MSMNFNLLKYWSPIFIETGTFYGTGVRKALKTRFKKIYSIELKKDFYDECKIKFKNEIQKGKVELFLGSSATCLPDILTQIDCRATFWLDAHYCSGETARGTEDVPLMKELDIISKHRIKTHTILIDDVRLFGKKVGEDWSNIQLDAVIKTLKMINCNYTISYEKGCVPNDVIVAEIHRFNWYQLLGKMEEIIFSPIRNILRKIFHVL